MGTELHREAAKIIPFPRRPRIRGDIGSSSPAGGIDSAASVVDTCWYHDEAVKTSSSASLEQSKPC